MNTPEIKLEIESTVIVAKERKLKGDWKIDMMPGWPLYAAIDHLPEDQQLDDRLWPRHADGKPVYHIPLTEIKPGMRVIWKGSLCDYVWNFGIITEYYGDLHVEAVENKAHWGNPVFDKDLGQWVTHGACYFPQRSIVSTVFPYAGLS